MSRSEAGQTSHYLKQIKLFNGLSADKLDRIQRQFAWRSFDAGDFVVNHLDESSDVYCLASGVAHVDLYSLQGKVVMFCELVAGDMFGEVAAIDGEPRSATIEAQTKCLIGSMSADCFRNLVASEPVLNTAVLQYFASKIRSLTTRVYEMSTLAVNNRIQSELLRLSNQFSQTSNTVYIVGVPTHAEIASRVGTHREAVTREFSRLSKIGVVERRGSDLIIRDINRLVAMVRDATGE